MTGSAQNRVSLFSGVDYRAVGLYLLLTLIGLSSVLSASWDEYAENVFSMEYNYMKQALWLGISWGIGVVILLLDRSIWHKYAYFGYVAGIIALVATLFLGVKVNGARAWFQFGSFRIQPMEFAKIAIALATARMMSEYSFSVSNPKDIMKLACLILLPMGIVVLQNDTGSGIVLGAFLFMLYREGLNNWLCVPIVFIAFLFIISFLLSPTALLILLVLVFSLSEYMMSRNFERIVRFVAMVFLASFVIFFISLLIKNLYLDYYTCLFACVICYTVFTFIYSLKNRIRTMMITSGLMIVSIMVLPTSNFLFNALREHQQHRIESFLGIVSDPTVDYNVNQSKIAIGSGGLLGKGYLQGSQIRYGFVPERHTDFIFCTIGEELGFVGCVVVLTVMFLFILRLMRMGDRQQETFGRVYCYCVASIFLFHTLVNVGMTIGLIPVMGIPLPLISYGGSSLMAFTIMVFIAFSMDAAAHRSNFETLSI